MKKQKNVRELSYKRRLTRLFKYFDKNIDKFPEIEFVKMADVPAQHALLLGISTKQTFIIFKIKDKDYLVGLSWIAKDSYVQDDNSVNMFVGPLNLENYVGPKGTIRFEFDSETKSFDKIDNTSQEVIDILKPYYREVTDILWDKPNSIKFITGD